MSTRKRMILEAFLENAGLSLVPDRTTQRFLTITIQQKATQRQPADSQYLGLSKNFSSYLCFPCRGFPFLSGAPWSFPHAGQLPLPTAQNDSASI